MTRRRLLAGVVVALAVAVLVPAALRFRAGAQRLARGRLIDWDNFDRIDVGMTRQEVESILGGPPGDFTTRRMLFFSARTGRAASWELWAADRGQIEVEFDEADIVQAKYFAEGVPVPLPSFTEQARDWLRCLWP